MQDMISEYSEVVQIYLTASLFLYFFFVFFLVYVDWAHNLYHCL